MRNRHATAISWTHFPDGYLGVERWRGATWNPTVGCTRVSPGCDHCYAFALHDSRYAKNREALRLAERYPESSVKLPFPPQYDLPFSQVQLLEQRVADPLHWRTPRAVFVDSMADLFHPDVPDDFLDRVFASMALAPRHIFMVLTKRPERMREYVLSRVPRGAKHSIGYWMNEMQPDLFGDRDRIPFAWPLENVWLGTSVEGPDQTDRLAKLRATPAAIRFVSMEPLLAPVDMEPHLRCQCSADEDWSSPEAHRTGCPFRDRIHWVLVGGESGPHHRPMGQSWVADIQRQCHQAGVAYFGKQRDGARPGLPLPGELNEHQWPNAYYLGEYHSGIPV